MVLLSAFSQTPLKQENDIAQKLQKAKSFTPEYLKFDLYSKNGIIYLNWALSDKQATQYSNCIWVSNTLPEIIRLEISSLGNDYVEVGRTRSTNRIPHITFETREKGMFASEVIYKINLFSEEMILLAQQYIPVNFSENGTLSNRFLGTLINSNSNNIAIVK